MKFPSFYVDLAFEVMSAVNMDIETRPEDKACGRDRRVLLCSKGDESIASGDVK